MVKYNTLIRKNPTACLRVPWRCALHRYAVYICNIENKEESRTVSGETTMGTGFLHPISENQSRKEEEEALHSSLHLLILFIKEETLFLFLSEVSFAMTSSIAKNMLAVFAVSAHSTFSSYSSRRRHFFLFLNGRIIRSDRFNSKGYVCSFRFGKCFQYWSKRNVFSVEVSSADPGSIAWKIFEAVSK